MCSDTADVVLREVLKAHVCPDTVNIAQNVGFRGCQAGIGMVVRRTCAHIHINYLLVDSKVAVPNDLEGNSTS